MLVTLADLKTLLGITGVAEDAYLTLMCGIASDIVEKFCGRVFTKTTYPDEIYEGTGNHRLVLRQSPIVSITSIKYRTGTPGTPQWQTIDDAFYYTNGDTGIVYMDNHFFGQGNSYAVTYEAGYTTIPSDLQMAVALIVGQYRATKGQASGMKSETLGEYSYTKFEQKAQATDIISSLGVDVMLSNYRTPVC